MSKFSLKCEASLKNIGIVDFQCKNKLSLLNGDSCHRYCCCCISLYVGSDKKKSIVTKYSILLLRLGLHACIYAYSLSTVCWRVAMWRYKYDNVDLRSKSLDVKVLFGNHSIV